MNFIPSWQDEKARSQFNDGGFYFRRHDYSKMPRNFRCNLEKIV